MIVPNTMNAQRPAHIVQASFNGGMRDREHPSLLEDNEFAYMKNGECRDGGLAKLRRARRSMVEQLGANPQGCYYYTPLSANAVVVAAASGRIYKWEGSGASWTLVDAAVQLTNTTDPVNFVVIRGRLYILSGALDNVWSWDGTALTLTDESNNNTDPPRGNIGCQQAGRMFVAGVESTATITNARDYYFPSDVNDGQTFNRSSNNQITPTDGTEAITAMVPYRNEGLLVFTRNSTHIWDVGGSTVTGDNGFTRTTINSKIGCIAPRSVVVVGNDAFFLSADMQVRTIKTTDNDVSIGVAMPVTFLVPNLMNRINKSKAHLAAGVFFDNYYLLAVPLDSSSVNNAVLVFDMLHQRQTFGGNVPACMGEWTNIAVNQWVVTGFDGVSQLYYMDSQNGGLVRMFSGINDDGTTIPFEIQTKAFDMGYPYLDKTAHGGEIQVIDSLGTFTIAYAKDDGAFTSLVSRTLGDTTSAILPVTLPFTLPGATGVGPVCFTMYRRGRSRYWQLKLTHSGERLKIKQFSFRAWVESPATVC